ncbi:protein with role in RNA processing [Cichlidogyrus casuarinus]|uniref:Protein with role in RNA processing n=1 Tax=Cichlidogyrus casuarinus TaxID=1844966 RepID=A0ABD2QAC5_9PLAT
MSQASLKPVKPGSDVQITYNDGIEYRGAVIGWSLEKKLIMLQCKSESRKVNAFDIVILKPELVRDYQVIEEGKDVRQVQINIEKLKNRINRNEQLRKDEISLSKCDEKVRTLFEHLRGIIPDGVRFEDERIILKNTVIEKPYTSENISFRGDISNEKLAKTEKDYVTKVLKKFYSDSNNKA